jgi:hypothetical protein
VSFVNAQYSSALPFLGNQVVMMSVCVFHNANIGDFSEF